MNPTLVHRSLGRFAAGLDHAEAALRNDPDSTDAATLQADLRRAPSRSDDAGASGLGVPVDDPGLANVLLARSRFIEAKFLCQKALRLRLDLAEASNSLGGGLAGPWPSDRGRNPVP